MPWSGSCGRYSWRRNRLSGSQIEGSRLKIASISASDSTTWIRAPLPPWSGLSTAGHPMSPANWRERSGVVEGDRARVVDAERPQQRRLGALAQLEREDVGAVEHAGAEQLQRSHVGERQRHGPRVPAKIRAGARLVEVEPGVRRFVVAERGAVRSKGANETPRRVSASNSGFCHSGCSCSTTRSTAAIVILAA